MLYVIYRTVIIHDRRTIHQSKQFNYLYIYTYIIVYIVLYIRVKRSRSPRIYCGVACRFFFHLDVGRDLQNEKTNADDSVRIDVIFFPLFAVRSDSQYSEPGPISHVLGGGSSARD